MIKIYSNYSNKAVIEDYIQIIASAFTKIDKNIEYIESLNSVKKDDWIFVPLFTSAFKLYFKGCKNIILWQQGLNAEESFMRNKSYIRKFIIEQIEKFILKRVKLVFFVSKEMKRFYESKYRICFKNYIIMPCFNEVFHEEALSHKLKYKTKIFTYVGSLAVWQCFDRTIEIFKNLEVALPEVELRVFTFDVETAKEKLNKSGIKNYSVEFVQKEMIIEKMKPISYGFVIRDNSVVNQVSTPTKLSSYMAAGVIPIFSDIIADFRLQAKDMKYACALPQEGYMETVINFINKPINKYEIMEEYRNLFNTYYGKKKYIEFIAVRLREIIY